MLFRSEDDLVEWRSLRSWCMEAWKEHKASKVQFRGCGGVMVVERRWRDGHLGVLDARTPRTKIILPKAPRHAWEIEASFKNVKTDFAEIIE